MGYINHFESVGNVDLARLQFVMTVNVNDTDQKPDSSWKLWRQRRYILAFLVFLGFFNLYSLRANMSIAIVAMTQNRFDTLENGTKINIGPEFKWDNKIQGYVLSSFFYGYLLTQIPGGISSQRFGGKFIFGCGVGSTASLTIVSPWLAELNPFCLIAGRILMGLLEGMTFASLYTIWAKWIPPSERSRVTSQSFSGGYTGTVFAMFFYAYLAQIAGWRSIFWFSGGLGLLWCLAWYYFTAESPENDTKISAFELEYIQQSLKASQPTRSSPMRWNSILTSMVAWAINMSVFCETWGYTTLITLLPKYFKDIYKFDLSRSGSLSGLPYIALAILMQVAGQMSDWIVLRKWLSISHARKTFMAVGFLSQTLFMMGAAFCTVTAGTVFCLVMSLGMGAFVVSTISVNALDIAPLHSSVLVGVANTVGSIPGIMSPTIAGYMISTENPTVEQWRIVFYISAGIYLFGAIFYTSFGSGLRQSWDRENDDTSSKDIAEIKS